MTIPRSTWLLALLLACMPSAMIAQDITAFKTGEEATGMTRQCYYAFGTTKYTKTIQAVQLCPLSIAVSLSNPSKVDTAHARRSAITAYKTGEETTGMTKQCFYAFGATKYTHTVQAVQLCPLSIMIESP